MSWGSGNGNAMQEMMMGMMQGMMQQQQQSGKGKGQGKGSGGKEKPHTQQTKLFVGGITPNTWRPELEEHFGKFGKVVSAIAMTTKEANRHRGFGFVVFASKEEALAACAQQHVIDGKQVEVKIAAAKEDAPGRTLPAHLVMPESCKLFLGGLHPSINKQHIRDYFSKYGTVLDCTVMVNSEGQPRGFGFVTFDNEMTPLKVLQKEHAIEGHMVQCRPCEPSVSAPKVDPEAEHAEAMAKITTAAGSGAGGGSAYLQSMMLMMMQMQAMAQMGQVQDGAGVLNVPQHQDGAGVLKSQPDPGQHQSGAGVLNSAPGTDAQSMQNYQQMLQFMQAAQAAGGASAGGASSSSGYGPMSTTPSVGKEWDGSTPWY
eukprot:gnl/TRDRNA2_/TRDRNA2_173500_c0_seq6.p1 gnl/TRDRNA2_/TRDRNA2_173500_c0~~gnl/TRDRNA2_/TRDRNA2_173500_c0_seq6.p1  ORF type:complete len:371 (+),score=79.07 gnl/TRDRNA2_/TRDRNA2_173500_c0_seq6:58-1170(+)